MSTASQTGASENAQVTADVTGHEVGSVWDLCLSAEFDQDEVVKGIAGWLGSPESLSVLDCACGSGFPSLRLHGLGYRLTCTDGSAFMLELFRRKAQAAGATLEPRQVRWEQLGALYPAAFDVVMCRGCSLIYAGTWDTHADPDRAALVSSVESFVQCLRPGGRLYVDTTREEDLYGEYPQVTEYPPRMVDGHSVQWREHLTADPQARVRNWQVSLTIDDKSISFERKSHYLPHDEFRGLLSGAGLVDIEHVDVPGEHYAVFVGRRPPA
ncbi:MAG TPA: class I SAM-dependent methyltransferase [Solirubrobacteraceae bacterium]|nr:class I SAM-dependent methyltransferase [Solirubrobacteraceae bacterium]